jgi:phosphoribosylformylglycinamidine synthase subunit PurQ / glutaminase
MKASVIVFPGSNCDRDVKVALEKFQIHTTMVWHQDTILPPTDLVVLPGGFSYGDYLRCGSMASKSKVMHEVIKHAEKGGYLFAICNGFQILTETNLLPGALLRNNKLKFICKNVFIKTVNNKIAFTKKIPEQKVLSIPIAHNEGNYFASKDQIKELQDNQQIVFQYCDKNGTINSESNPNGSFLNIAGITNKNKNILGMMPHPERVIDSLLGGIDGEGIFQSLL